MPNSKLPVPVPPDEWAEMSDAERALQVDRRPPPDPPSGSLTLAEARQQLAAKAQALPSVPQKDLANFLIDTQKLRVLCMLLAEAEEGKSDPNTYREMSMLNRLLAAGPTDDPSTGEDLLAEQAAGERLAKRGVSKESIPQIVRVLSAISSRMPSKPLLDEDDEGDEPDMAPH